MAFVKFVHDLKLTFDVDIGKAIVMELTNAVQLRACLSLQKLVEAGRI